MAAPRSLVKLPPLPVRNSHVRLTLFCPLFEHQKDTDACTTLRAKRICRMNCKQYFDFAKANESAVRAVIAQQHPKIINCLKAKKTQDELYKSVLPQGDYICDYCSKTFKRETILARHLKKKHPRQSARRGA